MLRGPVEPKQYTSLLFTQRCSLVGIEISNGSRGDCFDNAAIESFHATLKKDLIHRRSWSTKTEARTAMFEYIEAFYNRRRRHSRLGMLSPVDYENSSHTLDGDKAASRLAHTDKIINTTMSTAAQGRLEKPCPPKRGTSSGHLLGFFAFVTFVSGKLSPALAPEVVGLLRIFERGVR